MQSIHAPMIHRSRGAVLLSMAVLAALLAAPSAGAAAVPTAASRMTLDAGSVPMTLVQTAVLPGGDVSSTWGADGARVQAAGAPGSRVSLRRVGTNSVLASIDPPATPAMTPDRYAASGRSVYWDALGAGMTRSEAVRVAQSVGASIPPAAHVPGAAVAGSIFNSVCTTVHGGYYNAIWGTSCLVQSFLQRLPGQWYIENQVTTSGQSPRSGLQPLTQLQGWYCYCANGFTYTRVGWSPSASRQVGTPTTYTLSAGYGGFSVSVSETQYPNTLGPVFPSGVGQPAFGSVWKGSNHAIDDANSVAIIHNGPGSPSNARVNVEIWWVTLG